MSDIFERFTAELTAILKTKGIAGIGEIAEKLRPLLADSAFAAETFTDETVRKRVLFHDPVTGVYVQAHLHEPGKRGKPHSHGASWAVYGNLRGYTNMTEWRKINPESEEHAVLEPATRYRLGPGDSRAYPPHMIHSTEHPNEAWVIRVTGTDLDTIPRYRFDTAKDRIAETP
jgi:predicted metal-dependent enzyme (double-stranded beta helix superfamily)